MRSIALTTIGIITGFFFPLAASAHETQQFRIDEKEYKFVVGSLNEPVVVDDKSGVELTVTSADEKATPVEGLDHTLKVEVSAGDVKKIFDLLPQFGKPGSYKAVFFPTVQTTLTYRFFGTLEGAAIDLSFSCNPAGHPQTEEDRNEIDVAPGVMRTLKRGAFGCPSAKEAMGFPEPSAAVRDMKPVASAIDTGLLGVILGGAGLLLGGGALLRKGA